MPFEKAVELLSDILKVNVSKSRAERCTEAAGAAYVAIQTEEADKIERQAPLADKGSEKMVFSADGATPHLRWVQVWFPCSGPQK